ncbi:MAG: RNB domain-containing ribonuclease, partial [Gemmatimonadetes bacterium]|nr:RNB domain-containing ribonuclease [Gemmatimonadota bacterium]
MAHWERHIVGSVPAQTLDVQTRERLGDWLRSTRDLRPQQLNAGVVVEFLHAGRLCCGFLRSTPAARTAVLLIDQDGQERRLRVDKIVHFASEHVAVTPKARGLEQLRLIDRQRAIVADRVDLVTLRELTHEAGDPSTAWSVEELCKIHDSTDRPTSIQRVAMLRALYAGQDFRRMGDRWISRTPEALSGAQDQRRRAKSRAHSRHEQGVWLRQLLKGEQPAVVPPNAQDVLEELAQYVLADDHAELGDSVELVHAAHLHGRRAVFDLLVHIGFWQPDENLELHRQRIPREFSSPALLQADQLVASSPLWRGWPCWGQAAIGVVDPEEPELCQRAWSVQRRRRGWRLYLHIALPTLWIPDTGPLADEIRERGVRVSLPDQMVPLVPRSILRACCFNADQRRGALTIVADVDDGGELRRARLRRSRLRLQRTVETTESNEQLPAAAVALAARLRETRSAIGGWEHLGGERFVECRDAEMLCGRRTVDTAVAIDGELHRFGEQAAAVLFANAEVAAIYRTRVEPSRPPQDVPEMSPLGLSLYRRWEMEGHCPAERLQTGSAEHAGEGTGPRAIGLSPGASVADMLMQKQLRSLAGDGEPVSDTMLEHWLERQQACQ